MRIRVICIVLAGLAVAVGGVAPGQAPSASHPADGAVPAGTESLTPTQQWAYRSARPTAAMSMADAIRALPPGRKVTIDAIEPKGESLGVYLNLMHGKGTAWFDDVSLTPEEG